MTLFSFENSTTTTIESWFIPFDIIIVVCTILVIIVALIFLLVIVLDKTCHTIPIMLIANSCLAELILGCDMFADALFVLRNDLTQIQYQDSLCTFRCYLGYAGCALQNYSYLLSSIYSYLIVVYPTRLVWQTVRIQILFTILTWIFSFAFSFAFLFTDEIIYSVDNQICQIPLRFSFSVIYGTLCSYMIPITIIILIYLKLVRYVKGMTKRVTPANTLLRARRELKMVRRIVILVMCVTAIGFPYSVIVVLSFFNRAPKYHFRIAYIFVNISMLFVMIALFQITDPIKKFIMKKIQRRSNVVVAWVA